MAKGEIKIELRKGFTVDDEKIIMTRLHQIIKGSGNGPFGPRDSGYKWQLDESNDWWAEIIDGVLIVIYRYGDKPLQAIEPWLKYLFEKEK